MVDNVMPITQEPPLPQPRAAARLCNFRTGFADPLEDHKNWIDEKIGRALGNMQGAWVDLIGYASKLGNAESNKALSARRVNAVRDYIATWKKGINFQQQVALGEEQSTGDESNDDGYFRAVEVYFYGFAPPPLGPRVEKPKPTLKKFFIRPVSALSIGIGIAGADAVAFDIGEPTKRKWRRFIYTGASMNISIKIPGLSSLPPIGSGGAGPSKPFTASRPCEIEDFEGEATLFNGPGVAIGPISVGGEMGLSIESKKLVPKRAIIRPRVISMSNDTGLQLSFGGAGKGRLNLMK